MMHVRDSYVRPVLSKKDGLDSGVLLSAYMQMVW